MAITKETEVVKIEVVNQWDIQIKTDTVVKEDGVEISRTSHRHFIQPCKSVKDYSNDKWTHTDTDISSEDSRVQAVAKAIWTDSVKKAFKSFREAQPDI
tara:strand:- start:552 stop:848 length:297 start_codon:yes stop_codon:yes gene_type:complete